MKKFALLTSVLLTAPFSMSNVSAQCVASQDCASLGYTETSCESGGIKCPFGNAWACSQAKNKNCTYGSIYYRDGTCLTTYDSSKTPLGVVVYDEDNEKWIIALEDALDDVKTESGGINEDAMVPWSYDNTSIPAVQKTSWVTAIHDINSCENTDYILGLGGDRYPAAQKARDYFPQNAPETKGKWCLPAHGIMYKITYYLDDINKALEMAKGSPLLLDMRVLSQVAYWSSTGRDYGYSWALSGSPYLILVSASKTIESNVRSVMKI